MSLLPTGYVVIFRRRFAHGGVRVRRRPRMLVCFFRLHKLLAAWTRQRRVAGVDVRHSQAVSHRPRKARHEQADVGRLPDDVDRHGSACGLRHDERFVDHDYIKHCETLAAAQRHPNWLRRLGSGRRHARRFHLRLQHTRLLRCLRFGRVREAQR
eukprot:7378280-Prymnesium_polylepis.1